MTRKLLELSLAFFFIVGGVCLIIMFIHFMPILRSGKLILDDTRLAINETKKAIEETQKVQQQITKSMASVGSSFADMLISSRQFIDESKNTMRETQKVQQQMTQSMGNVSYSVTEMLDSSRLFIDETKMTMQETRQAQQQLIGTAEKTQEVLYELGIAFAAVMMAEQRMLGPTEAEKMVLQSIESIENHSERLGKLVKSLNDYRLSEQRN